MATKRPSLLGALLILALVGGVVFWWVNSMPNEDPLWFVKSFKAEADWMTVYWEGETCMFFPGDPEYERIMSAFADSVAHWSGYEQSVGLSCESLGHLREQARLLELHYNEPVQVHTRYPFSEARSFWVPLSGSHAQACRVFGGLGDEPRIGVLNVSSERYASLEEAVHQAIADRHSAP